MKFWRSSTSQPEPPKFGVTDLAGPDGRVALLPDPDVAAARSAAPDVDGLRLASTGWTARKVESTDLGLWSKSIADGYEAADLWQQWRDDHARTGLWPILVEESFWEAVELPDQHPTATATATTGQDWLLSRLYAPEAPLADQIPRGVQPALDFDTAGSFDWADALASTRTPATELVLIPAATGWLVPEALYWDGAVNNEVMGADHTVVLRRWAGRYGAQLVGLDRDVLTLRVDSPPATVADARLAAVEATAYCSDAVFQGAETLENLTEMMCQSLWSFWWD